MARSRSIAHLRSRACRPWLGPDGQACAVSPTVPFVHLIDDPAGREANRFGARTSGLVALYGHDGRLLFRGGITVSRGHEGDNEGRRALLDLIQGNRSSCPRQTPVFGCPIFPAPLPSGEGAAPWTLVNCAPDPAPTSRGGATARHGAFRPAPPKTSTRRLIDCSRGFWVSNGWPRS